MPIYFSDDSFQLLNIRIKAFLGHICSVCLGMRARWFFNPLHCCYKVFFIWDIQCWAEPCLVRRYFFTFEIHWMCHMMWNPNLHIPYFWSEFPGKNVTHPAASAYGMCLWEARSCRELLAVSSPDGRSLSRLPATVSYAHSLTLTEEFGKYKRIVNILFRWAHARKCRSNGGIPSSPRETDFSGCRE